MEPPVFKCGKTGDKKAPPHRLFDCLFRLEQKSLTSLWVLGYEEGIGCVCVVGGGTGGAAWCLLHRGAWHVAPALTAAHFLHSPTTAGTVHPPDPAFSSQNKVCFVPHPPHPPIGTAWQFRCFSPHPAPRSDVACIL